MHSFSTRGLPTPQAKLDYLKQVLAEVFTHLDVKPDIPDLFDNHISSTSIGRLSMSQAVSSPAHIIRRSTGTARDPLFFLHIQQEGGMHAAQEGREGWLEPGDMVLCDSAAPYDLGLYGASRTMIIGIPTQELTRRVLSPHGLIGRRLPGNTGPLRMVRSLVGEIWQQAEDGTPLQNDIGDRLATTMLDLFATACHMHFGLTGDEGTIAGGHRARIRRLIETQLFDPDLDNGRIAAGLGLSPRYLRLLFEGEGETISAYILRRRLEECAKRLRDPLFDSRTVTEVAFGCGFNDASHFSRVFKARFGQSPRDYRGGHVASRVVV